MGKKDAKGLELDREEEQEVKSQQNREGRERCWAGDPTWWWAGGQEGEVICFWVFFGGFFLCISEPEMLQRHPSAFSLS